MYFNKSQLIIVFFRFAIFASILLQAVLAVENFDDEAGIWHSENRKKRNLF